MEMPQKIKKRDGRVVDFDQQKITTAIQKAFVAVQGGIHESKLTQIAEQVIQQIHAHFGNEGTPAVEDVQNIVERVLMTEGFYDVAKNYIIYRYEHAKERAKAKEHLLKKIERSDICVIKRNGQQEKLSLNKLRNSLTWATFGLEGTIDNEKIIRQVQSELYDQIPTREIAKALVLATRSFTEQEPAHSKVAARLLRSLLYKEVIGSDVDYENLDEHYREAFIRNIKKGVEIGRLDKRLLNFDLEKLANKLEPSRDDLFMYLGLQTLYDRYFLSNPKTKEVLETPQAFWMRVAMGLSLNEHDKITYPAQFYEVISTLDFIPSTPTLFHAGTAHPQLSSCYLTTVEDSLDHIFKSLSDNAQLSKWSGGLGNDWTNLRGTGALIKGTGVESQGAIPFLKIANDVTVAINRSGRRRGATCAYLEAWHYDFEDFIELRKNTGDERRRTHDMNTAAWVPDLFMKRVRDDREWHLFSPDETPDLHHIYGKKFEQRYQEYEKMAEQGKIRLYKKLPARALWKKMLTMLFETGHPWITFKDPANIRSPQDHVGVIHNSNLCTEITLNTSAQETAVCNLGSVNLPKHMKNGKLDVEKIRETVTTAMRMLDNVIDVNFYPTFEAKNANLKHRPVGLGIMGFQDALYMLDVNFDSEEAVAFSSQSMEAIAHAAILASSRLAAERGAYESFKNSKWDKGIFPIDTISLVEKERDETIPMDRTSSLDWTEVRESVKKYGMRNSNCLAIAPTATISNIAGSYPCIEPAYKNIYVKSNMSGEFTVNNWYLIEDLKQLGLWNQEMLEEIKRHDGSIQSIEVIPKHIREKYKETFEIEPEWFIKLAAARGKWIDQSQSLNIFIKGTSGRKMSDVYFTAWQYGLKTTYYLRTLAASGVEKSTLDIKKQEEILRKGSFTKQQAPQPAPIAVLNNIIQTTQKEPQPQHVSTLAADRMNSSIMATASVHINHKSSAVPDPDCEACQ